MGSLAPLRRSVPVTTLPTPGAPAGLAPTGTTPSVVRPLGRDGLALTARASRPGVLDVGALEARLSRETGTVLTQGNRIQLHVDGGEAYPRIMATIRGAQKTLHLQMYIFKDDPTSWDVAEALADRAAHGVKVRVSCDYVGSATGSPIMDFLRANGVEVRHHTPDGLHSQVDHRKIIVADGKTAMTGGMNVGDEYQDSWHDVMATIDGPAVHEIQREFLRGWRDYGGSEVAADETVFAPEALQPVGDTPMRVVTTYPQPNYERSLLAAVDAAQSRINMEIPYFSDDALIDRLVAAAKRGVKVTLILPAMNDLAIMDAAAKAQFGKLQAAGVAIRLYQGRVLHAKVTTVDGVWGTLGSGNADARSLRLHREMNVALSDPAAVATLDARIFAADLAASTPVPVAAPGLAQRALDRVMRWISPVL